VARRICETGQYTASRLPGYPLPELIGALLWRGGPLVLNGCTAVFSAWAAASFIRAAKVLGSADPLLAGLALAMTPVVFVNSVNSMDTVWALALILASHHAVLIGRPTRAGVLLGLAIGCRMTSGAMLLPLSILLCARQVKGRRGRAVAALCLAACLVGALLFVPVFARYGWGMLHFSEPPDYPSALSVVSRATLHVWGGVGLVGVFFGVLSMMPGRRVLRRASNPSSAGGATVACSIVAVGLYAIGFARLPLSEGYLIPAVPFAILLMGQFLSRRVFRFVCVTLCLSPFVCGIGRAESESAWTYSDRAVRFVVGGQSLVLDATRGPILRAHAERVGGAVFVDRILSNGRSLPEGSVVIVGYWLPQIRVRLGGGSTDHVRYVYLLDEASLAAHRSEGNGVYYLPEMAAFNREVYGIDPRAAGAIPLNLRWTR
jgi:hypothetical protein